MAQRKIKTKQTKPFKKKVLFLIGLGILALAIPLTVVINQKDQNKDAQAATTLPTFSCTVSGATGATATATRDASQAPYNAVGNGTTDNATAIQNAINDASAAGGGVVTLPAGTFMINKYLLVKSGVKLQGAGMHDTIIKAGPGVGSIYGPNGGRPLITTNGASNITITQLTADQSEQLFTSAQIGGGRHDAYLLDIRNTTNAIVDHVATRNPYTYSIVAAGSNHFCIRDSETRVESNGRWDQLDGIHVLDSSFGDVINNTVDQRYNGSTDGDDGLVAHTISSTPTHDIFYGGNLVRGGSRGNSLQLAPTIGSIYNITIQNNEFYGAPEGIRTGYYTNDPGDVHDVVIGGGEGKGNIIRDLVPGIAFPDGGQSVWIFNSQNTPIDKPYNIVVTYNHVCAPGYPIDVVNNPGNLVANNDTNCSTPTSTIAPTAIPTNAPTPTYIPTPLPTSTPAPLPTNTPTPAPTGNGLLGNYFANRYLSGSPTLTRIDSTVNFDWGIGSPAVSIPSDKFSVRWTGFVKPNYSQTYTFYANVDDGVKVWVNNVRLVNKWSAWPGEYKGSIYLTAGVKYPIKIEYLEKTYDALAQLRWSSSSTPKQTIPQSNLYSK